VGDVVVIDQKGNHSIPVGILTDRDMVVSTTALGASMEAFNAEDVMSTSLVSAGEDESLFRVISLMKEHGVKRVPLVGRDHELTGIVAIEDIMAALSDELSSLSEVASRQRQIENQRRRKIA
jgi:CBS domain-containing protein